MAKENLTPRRKLFCDEWLIDQNGKRAAEAAGYSKNTARSQATHLLQMQCVKDYIAKKTAKRCKKLEITADRVLQEIGRIAFNDVTELPNVRNGDTMTIEDFRNLTADQRAAVSNVEIADGIVKIKFHDKMKALEMAAKHLKLFSDGAEVNLQLNAMGRVEIKHTENGETQALEFDIGQEPDRLPPQN